MLRGALPGLHVTAQANSRRARQFASAPRTCFRRTVFPGTFRHFAPLIIEGGKIRRNENHLRNDFMNTWIQRSRFGRRSFMRGLALGGAALLPVRAALGGPHPAKAGSGSISHGGADTLA